MKSEGEKARERGMKRERGRQKQGQTNTEARMMTEGEKTREGGMKRERQRQIGTETD